MLISLIADSGIQFYSFEFNIDPNNSNKVIKPVGFYENIKDSNEITLEYAYQLPNEDNWVLKKILKEEGCLDNDNRFTGKINSDLIHYSLQQGSQGFYTVNSINQCFKEIFKFKKDNLWLPIPYFKKNDNQKTIFGPVAWSRMMLKDITNNNDGIKTYKVVLAFDTKIDDSVLNSNYSPVTSYTKASDNFFALSNNEDHNLNFCDINYNCGWVDSYLKDIITNGKEAEEIPYLKYIAYYLYFIKYLEALKVFPEVILYSNDKQSKAIDVDLVLDIGNSNTCGVLFESPLGNNSFNFKSVKKLVLTDLCEPDKKYHEAFSMRLAFVEPKFGDIYIPQYKNFNWPSLLRLGTEASRFINSSNASNNNGKETATNHSSPKRYLWDEMKSNIPWEFINNDNNSYLKTVYYEGISEQFKSNGEYAYDGISDVEYHYSRKSLMTFVFMELILHANVQINSFEFRNDHPKPEIPRKIRRITITCPTSIVQLEQKVLRECAKEAILALERYNSGKWKGKYDPKLNQVSIDVIPDPKYLNRDLSQISIDQDWNYDEATCCQLVFLYAEISKRYLNNTELFFNLFGKKRNDVTYPNQNSLTLGSIDIGGGTTDIMICSYQYEKGQALAVIKPHPLYWESFNLAGDDLLKEIVQQIVLAGTVNDKNTEGSTGVLENSAKKAGVTKIAEKMLNFFGTDSAKQPHIQRIHRKNFVVQVAVPIALRYIQHTIDDLADIEVGFDELFPDDKPNADLLTYFNNHFAPLIFQDIKWTLSKSRVNEIIETTFDNSLKQITAILAAYGCDFVLLAGRPTTLPKIRELLIKYFPVSPERIITINDYRVGRWYPFADDIGYIEDPKTIVAVGALIALMGDKLGKLDGFNLKTDLLKEKIISTSDYIGVLNPYTHDIDTILLTPDINDTEFDLFSLPMTLGYKQLPNRKYRCRPIYKLEFNEDEIRTFVKRENSILNKENEILIKIDDYKNKTKKSLPFRVSITRSWDENREKITITDITDINGNPIPKKLLSFRIMTLPDERGYWLDSGEFILNIK